MEKRNKIVMVVEWVKTNADRIIVGVLSFIVGWILAEIYLFITN